MTADDDARYHQVLAERARLLAREEDGSEQRRLAAKVVVLRIGGEQFGLPLGSVREVLPMRPLATVPGLPPWLVGICQVRGTLLSVLDLATWWQLPGRSRPGFLAIVEGVPGRLGLLADGVEGFRDVWDDERAPTLCSATDRERPVRFITRDLLTVLDPERLLADGALVVGDARRAPAGAASSSPGLSNSQSPKEQP